MRQCIIWWLLSFPLLIQGKTPSEVYWVYFSDKNTKKYKYQEILSEAAISNRKNLGLPVKQYSDIPVKENYVERIRHSGADVRVRSKWFNAVSASLSKEELGKVNNMPFVTKVAPVNEVIIPSASSSFTSDSIPADTLNSLPDSLAMVKGLNQMEGKQWLRRDFTGKGVKVGVIDAGFARADSADALQHLFDNKRIKGKRDFLGPDSVGFFRPKTSSDYHGREVLNYIAGHDTSDHFRYGLASGAEFYLARTELGDKEIRLEEDKWIAAIEWLDSLGVRLVNTSLGYSNQFDDSTQNYTPSQMDGKTATISKAARKAVRKKGMVLVVSAGNKGRNEDWKVVCAPGDVKGALTVGSTNFKGTDFKAGFSSIGPDFVNYLKPDVTCFSLLGTSFSAPLVTGYIACLMEAAPGLSPDSIRHIMHRSGHIYPFGNNYLGYGVPKASRTLDILNGMRPGRKRQTDSLHLSKNKTEVHFKDSTGYYVTYHKKDPYIVEKVKSGEVENMHYEIKRPSDTISRSTFMSDKKILEIFWE